MSYRLIEVDQERADTGPMEACDALLTDAVTAADTTIVLRVPPGMEPGIAFVDWVVFWVGRFRTAGKRLVVVAENKIHFEMLEYSHPDQHLEYIASMEHLGQLGIDDSDDDHDVAALEEPERRAADPVPQPVEVEQTPKQQTVSQVKTDVIEEQPEPVPDYEPVVGEVAAISGEYSCKSCSGSRMWLKGDKVGACENAECVQSHAGWKLTFELF